MEANVTVNTTRENPVNLIQLLQDGPDIDADYMLFEGAKSKLSTDLLANPPNAATIQADLQSLQGCLGTLNTDAQAMGWTTLSNLLDEFTAPMQQLTTDISNGDWGDARLELSPDGPIGEIDEQVGALIWENNRLL